MELDAFNQHCQSLTASTKVIQWGGAHVWKVGGKIFAIASGWGGLPAVGSHKIAFKCSDFSYSILIEQKGIIPAPYLARAKWAQLEHRDAMNDEDIRAYIEAAHKIIAGKLTRKLQKDLGLREL